MGEGEWRGIRSGRRISMEMFGRKSKGRTNRLSSVRRTATPASTLPTVRDMSIVL